MGTRHRNISFQEYSKDYSKQRGVFEKIMLLLSCSTSKELALRLGVTESMVSRARSSTVPESWVAYASLISGIPHYFVYEFSLEQLESMIQTRFMMVPIHSDVAIVNGEFVETTPIGWAQLNINHLDCGVEPLQCDIIGVRLSGNSGRPDFCAGDVVFIDRNVGRVQSHNHYVLNINGFAQLMEVVVRPDGYGISYGPHKDQSDFIVSDLQVYGKLIYSWHKRN